MIKKKTLILAGLTLSLVGLTYLMENKQMPENKPVEPEYPWYDPFGLGEPSNKATIDAQNAKKTVTNTLAPVAPTATPQKPPAYVVKENKYADLFDAIEDIESFPDRTPEQRMKTKDGGSKSQPAIGPLQIRKIFVDEVNRQNHELKKNPKAPIYKHDDVRDYNKAREVAGQFLDLKMGELEKSLGRKPTNRELALFFHFGVANINQDGAEDYGKKFDTFFKTRKEKKDAKAKADAEAKAKAEAEAAAKAKK